MARGSSVMPDDLFVTMVLSPSLAPAFLAGAHSDTRSFEIDLLGVKATWELLLFVAWVFSQCRPYGCY